MRTLAATIVCVLGVAAAPTVAAAGTTRHVAVGGSASGACATPDTACTPDAAISAAVAGDRVLFAPGTYAIGAGLPTITKDITVEGDPAKERPVLVGAAPTGGAIAVEVSAPLGARPVLRHLDIRQTSVVGHTIILGAATLATAEDLLVSSASTSTEVVRLAGTVVLRDSVVRAPAGVEAITAGLGPNTNAQMRNVTASGGATGLTAYGTTFSTSGSVTTVRNSLLLGTTEGVRATGESGRPAVVLIDHSLFGTPTVLPFGSVDQSGGGNLAAAPLLVDLPGGDLREAAGSPTIDAGVTDAFTGPRDPDGRARWLGAAPDIGAYEFGAPNPPPPAGPGTPASSADTTPPTITLSRLPARTTVPGLRSGLYFSVTTDEPASLKASLTARRGRTGRLIGAKVRKPVTVTLGRVTAPLGAATRMLRLRTGPKVGRSTRFKATVTVTATDVAGNTARVSKTIAIGPGPGRPPR